MVHDRLLQISKSASVFFWLSNYLNGFPQPKYSKSWKDSHTKCPKSLLGVTILLNFTGNKTCNWKVKWKILTIDSTVLLLHCLYLLLILAISFLSNNFFDSAHSLPTFLSPFLKPEVPSLISANHGFAYYLSFFMFVQFVHHLQ